MRNVKLNFRRRAPRTAHARGISRSPLSGVFCKCAMFVTLHSTLLCGYSLSQSRPDSPPDTASVARFSVLPFPILYYTPETGVAGGAALVGSHRATVNDTSARPSSLVVNLIYTQKKQVIAGVSPDMFLDSGAYHIRGSIRFSRYPLRFYGIGNNTPDALEESYTSRTFRLTLDALRRIAGDFSGGVSLLYDTQTLSQLQLDGLLGPGTIPGSRGGRTVGAGVIFHWDTRDNIFTPSTGHSYLLTLRTSTPKIGSDFNFTYFTLDLRKFLGVTGRSVLAIQALTTITAGDVPFYFLSQLGGSDLMRGYFDGRYRDKELFAVQLEYRFPIFWRIGGAVFAGAGTVAPDVTGFSVQQVKPGLGLGLRYMYDLIEKLNVRIDFAFGTNSSGLYMTAYEAF